MQKYKIQNTLILIPDQASGPSPPGTSWKRKKKIWKMANNNNDEEGSSSIVDKLDEKDHSDIDRRRLNELLRVWIKIRKKLRFGTLSMRSS